MTMTDPGVRCDSHVGEVFPIRCAQCETLRAEFSIWPTLAATLREAQSDPPDQLTNPKKESNTNV